MKTPVSLSTVRIFAAVAMGFILSAFEVSAAPIIWNGPATTNNANNWSSGGNWTPTAPAVTDDLKFYDLGAGKPGTIPFITNVNNTVDVTTTNSSLLYGNTNGFHTTLIANGVILNLTSNLKSAHWSATRHLGHLTRPSPGRAARLLSATGLPTSRRNRAESLARGPLWI